MLPPPGRATAFDSYNRAPAVNSSGSGDHRSMSRRDSLCGVRGHQWSAQSRLDQRRKACLPVRSATPSGEAAPPPEGVVVEDRPSRGQEVEECAEPLGPDPPQQILRRPDVLQLDPARRARPGPDRRPGLGRRCSGRGRLRRLWLRGRGLGCLALPSLAGGTGTCRGAGEQRRRRQQRRPAAAGRVRRRLLGPEPGREPDRPLPTVQGGTAGQARPQVGPHHQRSESFVAGDGLRRQRARTSRADAGARTGAREGWHCRQRHLPPVSSARP